MTVKIPEVVILKTQKDVYDLHSEYGCAKRKVDEAERTLESAKQQLAYAETNLRETCEFLDNVSPLDKDWNWLEEIEDSLVIS